MASILVTGASGGIGAALVSALTDAGHTVRAVARDDADLSSYEEIEKLHKTLAAEGNQFDWIVCAQGYIDMETVFEQQTSEAVQQTFAVNTLSLFHITRLFLPQLKKGGGMIFISSTAGLQPNGRMAAYSASKAAVNALAQALARNKPEYTFISLCPGPTNTAMRERIAHDAAEMQSPSVVADAALAIVDGRNGYTSGDIIVVRDGIASIAQRI